MHVRIRNEVIGKIKAEAQAAYPYECCGFLLGPAGNCEKPRTIMAIQAVPNEREGEAAHRRFSIEPRAFLAAERKAEEKGWDVIGIYHSHPDHPAKPSAYDLEQALPWYTYVIVSVQKGAAGEPTAWLLEADRGAFAQEDIGITW